MTKKPQTSKDAAEKVVKNIRRNIRVARANDLIRVVTLHATVIASGSLTYLMGCGVASKHKY